ncbi:hypothetical protein NV377_11340 [Paenibacillus sp. T3-5-0-4]|nr:hypothetical protein [Paenibacillus endoradicis]
MTQNTAVSVTSDGVKLPWPGFSFNATYYKSLSDGIAVTQTGYYYITYHVNLTEAKSIGTRLLIDDRPLETSTIPSGHAQSSYSATVIVQLYAGSTISLQLYGASEDATLSQGQGASLSIMKVS